MQFVIKLSHHSNKLSHKQQQDVFSVYLPRQRESFHKVSDRADGQKYENGPSNRPDQIK